MQYNKLIGAFTLCECENRPDKHMQFENEIEQLLTDAEALLHDEKPAEALALLDRAHTLEPNHAWTQLFRGVALGQLDRVEEAVEELITAADRHADDIDIQVDVARHLSLLDQHQDAIICAERAVALDSSDAGAHAVQAEVLERLGRISDALPARETALLLDAEDVDSRYFLAVDLCDLGRHEEAYAVAEPLFLQFPDDPDMLRLHGACLSYLNRHQEALAKWAELERLEGITAHLLHNRANTLDALGLPEEALATVNEAITLEPDMALNYNTRGIIREHCDDHRAALEDYLTALSADHHYLDAAINLIELATVTNTVKPVLAHVNTLLELEPTSAQLLYVRARLQMEFGEFEQAQRALEEAICREPSLGIGWYTLSMLHGITGNPEDALRASERALHDFADDPGIWLNRGQAFEELKQFEEAVTCYDRAVALAPDDGAPWFHLGRLLLLNLERPSGARGALREALRLQPDNDLVMCLLGLCYLRLGQFDEAMRQIRLLLTRHPDHPWGWVLRAAWYAQRGELDAAFADLRAANSHGTDLQLFAREPLFQPMLSDPRFAELFRGLRVGRRK